MEYSCVKLNDLPDEILLTIFKKLANIEVLYSLVGVNKRLNKIAHDFIFTNNLALLMSTPNGFVYPLCDPILDRFCLHILPKIHQKIKWLELESQSIERILHATNYPNLYGISLYNIQGEQAINLFTDETSVIRTLKNQILSVTININPRGTQHLPAVFHEIIFTHIFTMFTNLQYLNFCPYPIGDLRLSIHSPPLTVISTNLLELHVCLDTFQDCLYLLDGRFNKLHTFSADINFIYPSNRTIKNQEKLATLKSFSLYCKLRTFVYDELILPLLHRMSNLEVLDLCLIVEERKIFVDGNDLTMNIINYMPQLNKFIFNIHSWNCFSNEINFPSNEDIQKTFKDFKDKQIICSADYFPKEKKGQCHIYSYPYKLKNYDNITNSFPGGIFKCVRKVSLFDERPFEHEFFLRIAQSFPLMEELTLKNQKQQINNQSNKSIIKYPHLKHLHLARTCVDYYEQFLLDTKTCLPLDVSAFMDYKLVKKVTRNFRRNTTRSNCAKLNYVYLCRKLEFPGYSNNYFPRKIQLPEHVKDYFPHAQID